MGIFSSKSKDKELEVNFAMMAGISGIGKGTAVAVGLKGNTIYIRQRLNKSEPYTLNINKVTRVAVLTETEILQKKKSVVGRALVGNVILGPLGTIIGGMSGIGSKEKKNVKYYMIINYISDEEKAISFEIVGASVGWDKLVKAIKERLPKESKEL